jgi:formate dehydrogenase major subunit
VSVSRRAFLKLSGFTAGGMLFSRSGIFSEKAKGIRAYPLQKPVGETPTICPYCAVGCGLIVASEGDQVVNIEGDPDHPINEGNLCSKGMSVAQVHTVDGEINPRRLQRVKYRAPGSEHWEQKSYDWALDQIARRVKDARDRYLIEKDSRGRLVNRLEAIASLGGAALDNEECSLIVKAMRGLGLVYLEHQARI